MREVTVITVIERPSRDVFEYMTDVTRFPEWQSDTVAAGWHDDGPIGVGSRAFADVRTMGMKMRAEFEVSNWDPPSSWGIKGSAGPVSWESLNRFEPHDGGTRLVQEIRPQVSGMLKIAEGIVVRQHTKQIAKEGQALKEVLEAAGG